MLKTCVATLLLLLPIIGYGQVSVSLIDSLKTEIGRKEIYVNQKLERIDKLQTTITETPPEDLQAKFQLYNEVYHEYRAFIYDSAFSVANKLITISHSLHDNSKIDYSRLKFAFVLMSSGLFKETLDTLKAIQLNHLPDTSRLDYYRICFRLYWDLREYNKDNHYAAIYDSMSHVYLDSAVYWSKPGTYLDYSLTALKLAKEKNFPAVFSKLDQLLKERQLTSHQKAMTYFELSNAYESAGRREEAIKYGALSAINDIRSSVKETAAIFSLAHRLYQLGDTENAYMFASEALDDAEFYGARLRKVQIISLLPAIAARRLSAIEQQRRTWIIISVAAIVVAVLIIAFVWILIRQLKKVRAAELASKNANAALHETNLKLLEAERIKEEYIGYYVNNNAQFLHKIEWFKNAIERKVQLRKFDDIRDVTQTINANSDRKEFHTNFDKAFIKLFPDFVHRFNALFPADHRIVLKESEILNTELRIFALYRLGVSDANKVAEILGYSINTIYSYKNRIKGRSIVPNDRFETAIMEIRSVEAGAESI